MIAVNGLEDSSISVSPFPPSLLPFSPHSLASSLSPSSPLCHPLSLVSSWQPIIAVPLSLLLMAQLLALMHFKHTAAATPQSDGKCTSSSSLCSFFHAILSHCVALHVKPSSMTPLSSSASWVKHAAEANLADNVSTGLLADMKLVTSWKT